MEKSFVSNSITINAPAESVWDALVNPEKTKIYMYGCEAVSNWDPGDNLIWKSVVEGKEFVAVKGQILAIRPGSYLQYSTFDPNDTSIEDVAENYLKVVYDLKEENGKTKLTASQGDFTTVAKGNERFEEVYNGGLGWKPMLEKIKSLVEANSL